MWFILAHLAPYSWGFFSFFIIIVGVLLWNNFIFFSFIDHAYIHTHCWDTRSKDERKYPELHWSMLAVHSILFFIIFEFLSSLLMVIDGESVQQAFAWPVPNAWNTHIFICIWPISVYLLVGIYAYVYMNVCMCVYNISLCNKCVFILT